MTTVDYRSLFETLPEGVFTIDEKWQITSFNHRAEEITGYDKQEAVGRQCWEVFRSDCCRKNCPLKNAMQTGETCMDQEVNTFNRKGTRQTLLVNAGVMQSSEGTLLGAVETFRSVSMAGTSPSRSSAIDFKTTGIIGQSRSMQAIFSRLPDIAASDANVLISGESGTGKELLALAIHKFSKYRKGPFVAVNCSALAESLLESELFGHEKGAFTGAEKEKPGRFELAKGGTLFLDEIGEMKPELQVKLLRVIEQRVFERVGGTRPIPLEARIISATNQDLDQARRLGRFRLDLYYRLRTVPLMLPPLRERPEDIPLLIEHFIKVFNKRCNKRVRSIDPKVVTTLSRYHWPGNVRELERCIEHAFVFVKGPVIFAHYLPKLDDDAQPAPTPLPKFRGDKESPLAMDKDAIVQALEQCNGRRGEAASLLGISRTSMWRRMKKLGLL